jgi:hypothetical protein
VEFHYPSDEPTKKRGKLLLILVPIIVVLVLLGVGGYVLYKQFFVAKKDPKSSQTAVVTDTPRAQSVAYTGVQGRYLFNGTIVLARAVEKYAYGDYNQPFSQLDTFNRGAYDAWSTDFECPITNNNVPYQDQIDHLNFNCKPEFLPALTKYFNLIDLANNHTDNQGGQTGIAETRKHLNDYAGVQYFGNYDPALLNDICEVVSLPVRLQKPDKTEEKAALPIAFCAWHYFNYNRGPYPDELAVVKKFADIMPVFAFVEMGNEYQAKASDTQVTIAHQLMDIGPEFLLANNPHWVQNAEAYKGKLIIYSLGNFIFDQIDTETQRGVSLDATATVPYDDNTAKWITLGKDCASFQDSCLQKAQDQGLKKIQLNLKYAPVASQGGAGKITHKADAATQTAVEQRLDWANVMKQIGQ